ncbi:multicopper oxidase domain-containing protein [Micromonospora sp. NPDC049559]|uniref:multicopper oxidase family protein n=1 Tax=Micromonospora sp. NPDC049559 TaxID=3155923 RepID=UPI00344429DF
MVARRQILAAGAAGGASLIIAPGGGRAAPTPTPTPAPAPSASPSGSPSGGPALGTDPNGFQTFASPPGTVIDPTTIPKYVTALPIPLPMPPVRGSSGREADEYAVGVRQFRAQVLPPGMPGTTVWGYGSPQEPESYCYPGPTIEARADRPTRITWINELVDWRGRYLPFLVPVDPTLHWANPPGGLKGRDDHEHFEGKPDPYSGPVPIVTHVHGAHAHEESDGYPEAWYLPAARDIPDGYARVGTVYDEFREKYEDKYGRRWRPGSSTFHYDNDQPAASLWYHDHTLGVTRLSVYSGLVGYYILRGGRTDLPKGTLPGPAPRIGDPPGQRYYEIPITIQDKSFDPDGELHYPARRSPVTPGAPDKSVPPIWIPNQFGETMVVNGRTWPVFDVEPRRYRFRLLNACNGRFVILKIASNPTARPAETVLPIWQIGGDCGFLPEPIRLQKLLLGAAERADVIVDFTGVRPGTSLYLINEGPDGHFGGGEPGTDFPFAKPETTGQVLKFRVRELRGTDHSVPPEQLELPHIPSLESASVVRKLTLNVVNSAVLAEGPAGHRLGRIDSDGKRTLLTWHSPVAEIPEQGATEIWEFHNFTPDAHPVHIHQVQFEVIGRGRDGQDPPRFHERCRKDTVVTYPGQITRVKAHFDLTGKYSWHCHIMEHEDNEMMAPFEVHPKKRKPRGGVDAGDGGTGTNGGSVPTA